MRRTPIKKKRKKTELEKLLKKCLHQWGVRVRERDGYFCQWHLADGKKSISKYHHPHHIVPRSVSNKVGWFDLNNGVTLCGHCHKTRLKDWIEDYLAFRTAYLAEKNLEYHQMRATYFKSFKVTKEYLEWKLEELK